MAANPFALANRFDIGMMVATPGAIDAIPTREMMTALQRHGAADWGDVCASDAALNDQALEDGTRLLSSYKTEEGTKFWIITEADRSTTTFLLPSEY
jgi:hypothetical protein